MKKALIIAASALIFLTSNGWAEVFEKNFESSTIDSLKLKNTSGKIKILGTQGKESKVVINKLRFDGKCSMKVEKQGSLLFVEIKGKSTFQFRKRCEANIDVIIPEKALMNLRTGSGDIEIMGTKGDIDLKSGSGNTRINADIPQFEFRVGSGNLRVDGKIGKADLKTGSGDLVINGEVGESKFSSGSGEIKVEGLMDTANIKTGSGDIYLHYEKIKKNSDIDIRTGSGDAIIYLPEGSKISTDFKTGLGKLKNEFGDSDLPDLKILFKGGSANLQVKKSK